jgi:hypothetical protein
MWLLVPGHFDVMQFWAQGWHFCKGSPIPCKASAPAIPAGDEYDEEHGHYTPAEHLPMYNVDMDPEDRTAVFDLALEDDSDDGGGLLDWSILAGALLPVENCNDCCSALGNLAYILQRGIADPRGIA